MFSACVTCLESNRSVRHGNGVRAKAVKGFKAYFILFCIQTKLDVNASTASETLTIFYELYVADFILRTLSDKLVKKQYQPLHRE